MRKYEVLHKTWLNISLTAGAVSLFYSIAFESAQALVLSSTLGRDIIIIKAFKADIYKV